MDYLLVPYLLYHHRIPIPHVCAGANLSFWPLGSIYRKLGGFFIRRSYEGNKLYAFAVQAYIEELIRNKTVFEFFIEGTRSRTGKLLPPRMGILSAIAQAYLNGASEEILLVPISVSYESVLEEKGYIDEQAGASKKQESFWDLLKLRKYLGKKKGKAYVQFGEPISARDFLKGIRQEEKKEKVQQLASELTYGINKSTVVTPASLVATALLTHPRRAISEKTLEAKIDRYLDYLRFKECRLSEPLQKYRRNAIRESLKKYSRGHLIEEYRDDDGPLYAVKEDRRPLLDYSKNSSLHFFVSMGVLATLLGAEKGDKVPLRKVEEGYAFLQELFQYEFTFSRRQPLRTHLEKLIEYLEKREIVRLEDQFIVPLSGAPEKLDLFSSPLKSFFESYYILWRTLPSLGRHRWESRHLLQFLQERGRILYLKEEISHPESLSRFTLQNAISSFRDQRILGEEREGWGKRGRLFYTLRETGEGVGRRIAQLLGKE
jgi:glycerol-3-phosphate O-acyltransferase